MEGTTEEPHFDITIDENEIVKGAAKIIERIRPTWPLDRLLFKIFTNGITNKLVGVWYPGHYVDMVLVRIYGRKTDLLIDRKDEMRNIRIMNKAGYTHSIYATFNNGLAYEFIQGETLTVKTITDPEIYCLVAKRMAEMHRLQSDRPELTKEPVIWSKTEKFMNIMPRKFSNPYKQSKFEKLIKPFAILEGEYEVLKEKLSKLGSPMVFAHNDLLLGNILYNKEKRCVTFIDYEYTGYNYQAFDIANHFAEFAGIDNPDYSLYPEKSLQCAWLKIYLETYKNTNDVSENDIMDLYVQVNKFVLLAHFFWGCWALIQSLHSDIDFDFLQYAAIRFNEYFKIKEEGRTGLC